MGRIIKTVTIKVTPGSPGEDRLAAFDTGANRSFVKESRLPPGTSCDWVAPITVKMGGTTHAVTRACHLNVEIRGVPFDLTAHPVPDIGTIEGQDLDLLVGAHAMEDWEMSLDPKRRDVQVSKKMETREFTEF